MSVPKYSRRQATKSLGLLMTTSAVSQGEDQVESTAVIPPLNELVNTFEFEEVAKLKLPSAVYSTIAGSDRKAFDRITLRPRILIPTVDIDLTTELFGEKMFAPILVGPVSQQQRYHPDGELATARGASAGKATIVVSSRSSVPIEKIAAEANLSVWCQVDPAPGADTLQSAVRRATAAGCKAVCIAVDGGCESSGNTAFDWNIVESVRQTTKLPVVLKGIMTPGDAKLAMQRGAHGVVVSNCGGLSSFAVSVMPLEVLASIVDAVGADFPVLVDGNFRRGSDIYMGLALGARAVLVARPVMWGLAAYGSDGVRAVLQLLQRDLGITMGGCGTPNPKTISRDLLRIHTR